MSADKFTPGPWTQDGRPGTTGLGYPCQDVWATVEGKPVHVADVVGTLPGDALLIASAPDLLAALEGVIRLARLELGNRMGEDDESEARVLVIAAQNALAKARGKA